MFYSVFHRRFPLILLVALLGSCDETKPGENPAVQESDSPRRTRAERASREASGICNALRNELTTAKKRLSLDERDKNLSELAWKALESNPEIAAEAILGVSSGTEEKRLLIEAYIHMLLDQGNVEEAVAWAASLGNDVDTQIALSKIAGHSALSNPEQDALQLSESNFKGEVDPHAEQVIRNWATKNPMQAVEWLRKMPQEEARANGLRILLGAWVSRDTSAAFSWISSQTNSQARQEVITGVAGFLVEQPAPIRDDLLRTADEGVRHEVLQQVEILSPAVGRNQEAESESPSEPEPAEKEDNSDEE